MERFHTLYHLITQVMLQNSNVWIHSAVVYTLLYFFQYTEKERTVILNAMDHWENNTCIRFVPRTTERDYISIYPGSG